MKKLMICLLTLGLTACAGAIDIDSINAAQYVCKDRMGVRTIHDNFAFKGVTCQDSSYIPMPEAKKAYRKYIATFKQEQ